MLRSSQESRPKCLREPRSFSCLTCRFQRTARYAESGTTSLQPLAAAANPCYLTAGLPQDPAGRLKAEARPALVELVAGADVAVLGPGLGQSSDLAELLGRTPLSGSNGRLSFFDIRPYAQPGAETAKCPWQARVQ